MSGNILGLSEISSAWLDDYIYTVHDPSGIPLDRRLSLRNTGITSALAYNQHVIPDTKVLADIQSQVNAVISSGKPATILFTGNHSWSGSLNITNANHLSIVGNNAKVTQTNPSGITLHIKNSDYIQVDGIHFIGKGTEAPWSGAVWNGVAGIQIDGSDDVLVHNCWLTNHAGGGIGLTANCNRVTITDNYILGMGSGYINKNDNGADYAIGNNSGTSTATLYGLNISKNHISGHAQGIGVVWCKATTIENNNILDIPGQHGLYCSLGGDAVIANNVIRGCGGDGIKVTFNTAADRPYPCNITGNSVFDVGANGFTITRLTGGEGFFRRNVLVANNIVDSADTVGMYISGQRDIHIVGNRVSRTNNVGYDLSGMGTLKSNIARECNGGAIRLRTPEGDWSITNFESVDCPINSGVVANGEYRSCMYLDDGASPSKIWLNDVILRYENYSPPSNMEYGINIVGSGLIAFTENIYNHTQYPNNNYSRGLREVVYPSFDLSGATDSANIAAAIQSATLSTSSRSQGTVVLKGGIGTFYVNSPIVIGNPSDFNGQKSVNLIGEDQAVISYVGSGTTDYLLTVTGATYSPTARISGLYLNCNSNCRGINFRQAYFAGLENTVVFNCDQVGVDFQSSWKSYCKNLHIWYGNGIALRIWYANGCIFDNIRIGNNSATNYPAVDDTTVVDYDGSYIVTASGNRGALAIDRSKECVFRSLMFESCSLGDKPLVNMVSRNCYGIHFTESFYTENNECTDCWVYLNGSNSSASAYSHDIKFENVGLHQAGGGIPFIKNIGYTDYVRVEGIRDSSGGVPLSGVISSYGTSSHLYRATVEGSRVGLPSAYQIIAVSGGTIETTEPYSFNYTATESPPAP